MPTNFLTGRLTFYVNWCANDFFTMADGNAPVLTGATSIGDLLFGTSRYLDLPPQDYAGIDFDAFANGTNTGPAGAAGGGDTSIATGRFIEPIYNYGGIDFDAFTNGTNSAPAGTAGAGDTSILPGRMP